MKAKIFTYFIIIVIMALLKIQILTWNHEIWQRSVSLNFFALPIEFNIIFKTEPAPSFICVFIHNCKSNKVRAMDCTCLSFQEFVEERGKATHVFSPVHNTTLLNVHPFHSSFSNGREYVERKTGVREKRQKKDIAFFPWLLKCCALSWTSGHWLQCNQNQKLAKGMFVCMFIEHGEELQWWGAASETKTNIAKSTFFCFHAN